MKALEFASDQTPLDPLLRTAGQQLESMIEKFVNVSVAEEVHEMRFDSAHLKWKEHRDEFRYVVRTRPFSELRTGVKGDALPPSAQSSFLLTARFVGMLGDLLPENQDQARFRYLGRIQESGRAESGHCFCLAGRDQAGPGLDR